MITINLNDIIENVKRVMLSRKQIQHDVTSLGTMTEDVDTDLLPRHRKYRLTLRTFESCSIGRFVYSHRSHAWKNQYVHKIDS